MDDDVTADEPLGHIVPLSVAMDHSRQPGYNDLFVEQLRRFREEGLFVDLTLKVVYDGPPNLDSFVDEYMSASITTPVGTNTGPIASTSPLQLSASELFRVHRCVVAAYSPVLRQMLSGPWSENESDEIVLRGIHPRAFRNFVNFCYGQRNILASPHSAVEDVVDQLGRTSLDTDTAGGQRTAERDPSPSVTMTAESLWELRVIETAQFADQYHVPGLSMECEEYVRQAIDSDNATVLLNAALAHNLQNLADIVVAYLKDHLHEVQHLRKIPQQVMLDLLRSSDLNFDEFYIFIKLAAYCLVPLEPEDGDEEEDGTQSKRLQEPDDDQQNRRKSNDEDEEDAPVSSTQLQQPSTDGDPELWRSIEQMSLIGELIEDMGRDPPWSYMNKAPTSQKDSYTEAANAVQRGWKAVDLEFFEQAIEEIDFDVMTVDMVTVASDIMRLFGSTVGKDAIIRTLLKRSSPQINAPPLQVFTRQRHFEVTLKVDLDMTVSYNKTDLPKGGFWNNGTRWFLRVFPCGNRNQRALSVYLLYDKGVNGHSQGQSGAGGVPYGAMPSEQGSDMAPSGGGGAGQRGGATGAHDMRTKRDLNLEFTLTLIDRKNPDSSIVRACKHKFTAEEDDWGFARFATLDKVRSSKSGFYWNNELKFSVTINPQRLPNRTRALQRRSNSQPQLGISQLVPQRSEEPTTPTRPTVPESPQAPTTPQGQPHAQQQPQEQPQPPSSAPQTPAQAAAAALAQAARHRQPEPQRVPAQPHSPQTQGTQRSAAARQALQQQQEHEQSPPQQEQQDTMWSDDSSE
eukprot:Clim_evm15s212 gene=Clim_evmTU15s212